MNPTWLDHKFIFLYYNSRSIRNYIFTIGIRWPAEYIFNSYLTGYCAARFKPIVLASIFDTGIIVLVNRIAEI